MNDQEIMAAMDEQAPAASEPQAPAHGQEVCVPVSAVAISEDDSKTTAPGQGDTVTFTMEGTVNRVEGDKVYISPTLVNGEPIPAEEKPVDEMAQEEAALAELSKEEA